MSDTVLEIIHKHVDNVIEIHDNIIFKLQQPFNKHAKTLAFRTVQ